MTCHQMDTVTYPDPKVREELANWTFVRVDVSENAKVAELFDVPAIPVALAATGEGEIVGRVTGFMEPKQFSDELRALRESATF